LIDSEAEHLAVARLNAKGLPRKAPLWRGERYRHDKIRVAYMSTDLRDHVVADAIAGCFEHHDKARFETYAISLGPNDKSAMRRRIESAFDRFINAQTMSDSRIAGLMRELEIDIVVDLNGNSGETRTAILARRPAPVQAHYLGFAGTMGASFMDYVIADRIVIPEAHRVHYAEKVVYLPHTYMPNDAKREIARTPSRGEAGLPESGFVFACHNQEYKLGPEIFDVWMRLLRAVEGSVLWLKFHNPSAMANLWQEANARGVASERLIFAPRLPRAEDHLARLRLADLFLDTRPYNAHATACDALWAGLPVLTCPGDTFPARVAASVLHAIGLPELVTQTLVEYEQMALLLARDPDRLFYVRAKLARNRDNSPLFDTAGITRDLESAYSTMWERQQNGLPPESFAVQRPG
jgi:predicted O-linked N-acetylglucosamine transferase (SPINDLY family)